MAFHTGDEQVFTGGVPVHRHLDTNGDGCVSEGELKQALGDLGFGGAAGAAAQEMVSEVASHADGVTLPDFLQFVKKVGVCCI